MHCWGLRDGRCAQTSLWVVLLAVEKDVHMRWQSVAKVSPFPVQFSLASGLMATLGLSDGERN